MNGSSCSVGCGARGAAVVTRTVTLVALSFLLACNLALAQTAPKVVSVTPANGATDVSVTTALVFVFDQPMQTWVPIVPSIPGVFVGNLDLSPAESVPSLDGLWSEDGLTLTCVPSSDWPPNTLIRWGLNPAGVLVPITSESGVPLAGVSGSFTTGAGGGGGTEPALVASTPGNGAMGVAVNTPVTFVFDQPMKKIAVIGDAVEWQGDGVDPAKFVYSWSADGQTLTCSHTGGFPANTVIAWTLNPELSSVRFESETGEALPEDTYSGFFMTAQGGGGDDCTPDGIPESWGGYSLMKSAQYEQTSSSDPAPAPETPFHFNAMVVSPRNGPAVTSGSVTLPNGTVKNLEGESMIGLLMYTEDFGSDAALEAAYPAGKYTLRFTQTGQAERAIAMTMPTVTVPVPKIANYTEAQSVNHAQDFTLRWNAFTGAGANDHLSLIIFERNMGGVVFQAPDLCVPRELPVSATSIVLPANTLQNNRTYEATLMFGRMFYFSTNAVPEMAGSGHIGRQTTFTVKTGTGGTGAAATFTGCRMLPNGNPEMTLAGTPLRTYTIQRTGTVGAAAWTQVGSVTMNAAGSGVFEDAQAGKSLPLFYRAVAN